MGERPLALRVAGSKLWSECIAEGKGQDHFTGGDMFSSGRQGGNSRMKVLFSIEPISAQMLPATVLLASCAVVKN